MIRLLIGCVLVVLFIISLFVVPSLVSVEIHPLATISYYIYCMSGGFSVGLFISDQLIEYTGKKR